MNGSIHPIYFPAAVLLGALHAMEPGHAKALTASYLIGIKGTKRDSVILGLSVATTHSIVVILISAIGIWLGNEAFTGKATEWLETGSGLVAVGIGCWMLWRRLFVKRKSAPLHHHHDRHRHPSNPAEALGILLQGGQSPEALSTGSAGLGVLTVLGFSLGLAVALVGIGMIIVSGLSKLSETGRLSWATQKAPVVSAALVIVSGLFALLIAHKG
jgi:nickel/cobalt exporter